MHQTEKLNLTVAVLGTGYMGRRYIAILKEHVRRVIVCSADIATGQALAEREGFSFYSDYSELFQAEHPDVAAICLPTPLHHPATLCALKSGAHVLCEKPFAATSAQAREMLSTAKACGRLLMVGHLLRFDEHYALLKQCMQDSRLGRLVSLQLFRHNPTPLWSVGNWLHNAALSGGVIKDLHIHDTDILYWLLGMPESVCSSQNEAACSTLYRYPSSVVATASASWRGAEGCQSLVGFDAVWENACMRLENGVLTLNAPFVLPTPENADSLEKEILYFCRCVLDGKEPSLCPPEESLSALLLNEAEAASAAQRCPVFLNN